MIKLLMFDLDGTLFDTAQGIANAFNRMLAERGEKSIADELISSFIGNGLHELLAQLDASLSHRLGNLKSLEADFRRHYNQNFIAESLLYPGVLAFLDEWPHDVAIVSNKHDYYVRELVSRSELKKFNWKKLIGGNSLPNKKPHPQPLLEVLSHSHHIASHALMIGDGLPDMLAAERAGVKSVAVEFGYTPISQLIQSGAHATIANYNELPKIIRALS